MAVTASRVSGKHPRSRRSHRPVVVALRWRSSSPASPSPRPRCSGASISRALRDGDGMSGALSIRRATARTILGLEGAGPSSYSLIGTARAQLPAPAADRRGFVATESPHHGIGAVAGRAAGRGAQVFSADHGRDCGAGGSPLPGAHPGFLYPRAPIVVLRSNRSFQRRYRTTHSGAPGIRRLHHAPPGEA